MAQIRVITFGTFDVFHVGHLRILKAAKDQGDHLSVGVSSDQFSFSKKGKRPVYAESERCEIVRSLKYVDDVFIEDSFELKRDYIIQHKANILIMGSDWQGKFDEFNDICEVVYLPRTPSISTSAIIEKIRE
ncbi:MAG: adenylyltransferase/cytidyltransferase family protein [Gammaproteobacteria bacterium]|nr:adenylyltransferase/cytidyltransferase family protein [Gammaproteobacteria bacterium]MDH3467292.1 adenylyltransferase/cytidyltransferase family protein [Gammaproteobacteria bacterium]